jgi:uncharacterized protein YdgA (DUF945 family)
VRKIIVGIVVALILLSAMWAGATHWFAVRAEEQYKAILEQASEAGQVKSLRFVNESYHRGFWVSKARTAVTLQHPAIASQEMAPVRFTLDHEIYHGPFPLGAKFPEGQVRWKPCMAFMETRMVLDPDAQSKLKELFEKIPELASMRNYTLIHLDGSGEDHFIIPAFQYTYDDKDSATIGWKGLFLRMDFSSDLKRFNGTVRMPGLQVSAKDVDLKLQTMQHTFRMQQGAHGLWLGEAAFDVPNFDFVPKEENGEFHMVLVQGLKMRTTAGASDEAITYGLALEAGEILIDGSRYGPGAFQMEIRNLDAASVVRLQGTANRVEGADPSLSAEALQEKLQAEYLDILAAMLKTSPEVEITRMELKTPFGDFAGTGKVTVEGDKWKSSPDLSQLPSALTADVQVKAGEDLVKRAVSNIIKGQILAHGGEGMGKGLAEGLMDTMASSMAAEQLQSLAAQNVLVLDNGVYSLHATFDAGQTVLNGRPLQLQDFMQ